ncbi:type I-E CRISPR-associated protein Cse2/CasB [Granulibacter bethesdensis]|uniref:type I-E CRISPR-associated protein Cse2/CasB n=1 Tax=Granulibacter bethesdensis TaxID=364410 RepID=UPI0003F1CCD5|nr:type I-E CRISPR-associated protein Cse2/CasB [Granulibacter bethesdensis]AHJ65827.1 Hypothetical protein GbCGDNIH4_1694 [Granulibacter bethesdensis CGDNIH4]
MSDSHNKAQYNINDIIRNVSQKLAELPPGNLASLRRAIPGSGCREFWRLFYDLNLEQYPLPHAQDNESAWEWVMNAIAYLTPTGQPVIRSEGKEKHKPSAHDKNISFGQALYNIKINQNRMDRLLNSPFEKRREMIMGIVRTMSASRMRFNMADLAEILTSDQKTIHSTDDPIRKLAKDYYEILYANSRKEKANA